MGIDFSQPSSAVLVDSEAKPEAAQPRQVHDTQQSIHDRAMFEGRSEEDRVLL